jgi:Domain of unknown function (DUF4442)
MTKQQFRALATTYKFQFFLLKRLPAAWFMGVRVHQLDDAGAQTRLPFTWYSQNPFKSIYFAAQAAAAELSTGILMMYHLQGQPPVSMLVRSMQAKFLKKANDTLTFTCDQGEELQACIARAMQNPDGETIILKSVGRLPNGDVAAEMEFTWGIRRYESGNKR